MNRPADYELLDFGDGFRLESLGGMVVERPCPAAVAPVHDRAQWNSIPRHGVFVRSSLGGGMAGEWHWQTPPPDPWLTHWPSFTLELRPSSQGQVGIFPEQAVNWDWIRQKMQHRPGAKILNLFGYTGASTLVAARAGAEVVHVDASKQAVTWGKRNAELSDLAGAPIRWIVEDVRKFVSRELKRQQTYDGIILDPPSYGHGPRGETWKLSQQLPSLLRDCRKLLSERPLLILLTCHTPGFGPAELSALVSDHIFGQCASGVVTRRLAITARSGKRLPAGCAAYWP